MFPGLRALAGNAVPEWAHLVQQDRMNGKSVHRRDAPVVPHTGDLSPRFPVGAAGNSRISVIAGSEFRVELTSSGLKVMSLQPRSTTSPTHHLGGQAFPT